MWRRGPESRSTRVIAALAGGLALMALALAVVLSGSPLVLAHANPVPPDEPIVKASGGLGACQDGETLPARTTAIRFTFVAVVGPRVTATVSEGGRVVAAGSAGSGWTSGAVTVPVSAPARSVAGARICFKLGPSAEAVEIGGSAAGPRTAARRLDGRPLAGRFTVEYMRPGASSWWSQAETVARRFGLGHAPSGTWLALLLLLAMGATVATAAWLAVRELG
jgi:hypothetical protein